MRGGNGRSNIRVYNDQRGSTCVPSPPFDKLVSPLYTSKSAMATIERQESAIQTVQVRVTPLAEADLKAVPQAESPQKLDIEHAIVQDDPREWPRIRKFSVVIIICAAAVIAGLGGNLYNPAISEVEADLHASGQQVSLTVSLFILIQGGFPVFWSAISEIYGRKVVYLTSISLCTVGCIVGALSKTINVLIGMRCIQAAGASAVVTIGAATLADLYEPEQRGTMMGIYLCAPLLGPSLGPMIGGLLTEAFDWRATFWFLVIFTGLCIIPFISFRDTFRRERSLTYQVALRKCRDRENRNFETSRGAQHSISAPSDSPDDGHAEVKSECSSVETKVGDVDLEAHVPKLAEGSTSKEVRLSFKDVNPIGPMVQVLRCPNNVVIIIASALLFAFEYSILYTASLTLANKYQYDALKIGLTLLSFGIGALLGSMVGGRYSDYVLVMMRTKNGGKSSPEMRLQSTMYPMLFLPASIIAYGWVCEEHVHVAAVCVMLFLSGFLMITIYSSTLAYIVDANTGRSSSAVSTNSCVRGLSGFIAAEIAVPLEDVLGDGGLYTLWGGLIILAELLIVLVWWKGRQWRERVKP
ncbi:MFS general substrate transporter [Daedalea quercina L-15889]|uniref:MFS general substrate transporter n=1 Tax=Daedalea quercina L-15889 TaxID=1314783 RepID=A0A165NLI7_9APHY|nr:MFS general substrate transporter [Daedalea quercina L-15889]